MFRCRKVGRDFRGIPLTHTVTHITIVYSGQGSTNDCFLITKYRKIEKTIGNLSVKFSAFKLCKSNNCALGL